MHSENKKDYFFNNKMCLGFFTKKKKMCLGKSANFKKYYYIFILKYNHHLTLNIQHLTNYQINLIFAYKIVKIL